MRRRTLALCTLGPLALVAAACASCTSLLGIDGDYHAGAGDDAGDESDVGAASDTTTGDVTPPPDTGADTNQTSVADAGPVVEVTLGKFHSCARFAGGFARCWGRSDDYGEFGDGTFSRSAVPVPAMGGGGGILDLFAGSHDTCAVLADGGECAGKGGTGELGNGVGDADLPVPVPTSVLPGVPTAIASGERFTCAIIPPGDVYCVGDSSQGELGNGSYGLSLTAVQVSLQGKKAVAIAAYYQHACAALADGTVACWGDDTFGQLGDGNLTPDAGLAVPVIVSGLPTGSTAMATAVGVGDSFSCALMGTDVWCWGDNSSGQLGDGNTNPVATPQQVVGVSGVGLLAVGGAHACAGLLNAGLTKCWGKGGSGQLGNNDTAVAPTPVEVFNLSYPQSLSAGGFHTCALISSPNVVCWGSNDFGQLGNGDAPNQQIIPVQVTW
ncbi:MAG TPA: hypothetical protein VIF15_08950 [Polyangiaceae bacterium]